MRNAGRADGTALPASIPECQEALSILLVHPGCVRSRHLVRCLLAAKGAAWLRPWFFRRILRASKHSSKAAARGGTSSLPAAFRKCYETSARKRKSDKIHSGACLKNTFCEMCFTVCGEFIQNLGVIAGYVD